MKKNNLYLVKLYVGGGYDLTEWHIIDSKPEDVENKERQMLHNFFQENSIFEQEGVTTDSDDELEDEEIYTEEDILDQWGDSESFPYTWEKHLEVEEQGDVLIYLKRVISEEDSKTLKNKVIEDVSLMIQSNNIDPTEVIKILIDLKVQKILLEKFIKEN